MGKINKNDRTQHKIDQHFSDKLRDFEANPPEFIWDNIEQNINTDKEKSKFDHWYYVILVLLIPITIANFLFNFNTENTSDELFAKTNTKIAAFFTKKDANISEVNTNTSISASNNHSENNNFSASTTSAKKPTNTSIVNNINNVEELATLNNNGNAPFTDKGNFRKRGGGKKATVLNNGVAAENKTSASAVSENNITLLPETGVIDSRILSLEDNVALLKYENANIDNITNKTLKNLKGFFVGADARVGNNWFLIKQAATNNFINDDVQYHFKYGSAFGISAGYNFSKNIGVEAEVIYSRQGQSFVDNSFRKVPIEGNIELAYIRTPLMFKYKWASVSAITQKPVVFNILFGPVYSRLIHSEYTVSNEQFAKKAIIPVNELGLTLGFEYDVFMSNNSYLTLGLRTGVSSDVNSFPYAGPNTLKTLNLDLGLNAAYNFQIRTKQKAITTF